MKINLFLNVTQESQFKIRNECIDFNEMLTNYEYILQQLIGAALTASSETAKDNDRTRSTQTPPKPERQKTDETPGQQPAGAAAATAPGALDQEQMFKDIFGEELTKEFSEEFAEVLRSLSEQQSATGIPTPLKPG